MKSLKEYIVESTKDNNVGFILMNMLKDTKTTRDSVTAYLNNLDMKNLKSVSDYINNEDEKNYIAFRPMDDEFISDTNKSNVIDKMSQYFQKYVCN